jgi:hypothetical protein
MPNPDPFALICLAVALLAVLWGFVGWRGKYAAEERAKAANEDAEAARAREDAAIEDALKVGKELQVARKRKAADLALIGGQNETIERLERRIAELERDLEWDGAAAGDADMRDVAGERMGYSPSEN